MRRSWPAFVDLFRKPEDVRFNQHLTSTARATAQHLTQALLTLMCLPYEGFYSLGAILRTAGRMWFTRTRLLEWNPSSAVDKTSRGLIGAYRSMWVGPGIAVVTAVYLMLSRADALMVAAPILSLWLASPFFTWWISRPLPQREARLTSEQTVFLRKMARKTWAFFETYVGPDDHWLPPDNYQEHPAPQIAHRTSPTNMGLALLANLSAYDFGYLSAGRLIERTAHTFDSMAGLERFRGHFYNWYDTQSLKPLLPMYISSVDSGNLAGHIMTLRSGLLTLPDDKILADPAFDGLRDSLSLLSDALGPHAISQVDRLHAEVAAACQDRPTTLATVHRILTGLTAHADEVAAQLGSASNGDAARWAQALAQQCHDALNELTFLIPWMGLPSSARILNAFPGLDQMPTLRMLTRLEGEWLPVVGQRLGPDTTETERAWLVDLQRHMSAATQRAGQRIASLNHLAWQSSQFAHMEYDFLFDETRVPAVDRLQRQRRDAGRQLLRSAGLRSETVQFRRDCARTTAAGKLVCPRTPAHDFGRRSDASFLERLDVRIPDAAPGHADL